MDRLKERDSNSAYFHKIANGRRRKNTITSIQSANGLLEQQTEIELAFFNFYKPTFGQTATTEFI